MESDVLFGAKEADERYHLARLIAQGFAGGAQVIWDEHTELRRTLLTAAAPRGNRPAATFDTVVAIHRKLEAAGLFHRHRGELN